MTPNPETVALTSETPASKDEDDQGPYVRSCIRGCGLLILTLFVSSVSLFGQIVPAIIDVTPIDQFPKNSGFPTIPGKLLITGSGFSSNAADLQVWFDQVAGEIVSASDKICAHLQRR